MTELGVVDGEYVCTRELELVYSEKNAAWSLSYYEMGKLVKMQEVSGSDEAGSLYPDLDYWIKG